MKTKTLYGVDSRTRTSWLKSSTKIKEKTETPGASIPPYRLVKRSISTAKPAHEVPKMEAIEKIHPFPFYGEWSGHPLTGLATALKSIQAARPGKPIVYLAGDSSLDNKAWVPSSGPGGDPLPVRSPDVYSYFLETGSSLKPDVAFWLNHFLGSKASVINAAVEASLLRQREKTLLPHDEFIRDNIGDNDILLVSLGANDIALSPTKATVWHMLQLAWLSSKNSIEKGTASSLGHFKHMFCLETQSYISRLVSKQKPRAVIVCMIYFPLEASASSQESWADAQLKMLGYGKYPSQLQEAIKQMYLSGTSKIEIEGTKVLPCALYEALDGKTEGDYVARVEPSVQGGRKMSEFLKSKLESVLPSSG